MAVPARRQVASPFSSQGTEEWQSKLLHTKNYTEQCSPFHITSEKKKNLPCRIRINTKEKTHLQTTNHCITPSFAKGPVMTVTFNLLISKLWCSVKIKHPEFTLNL